MAESPAPEPPNKINIDLKVVTILKITSLILLTILALRFIGIIIPVIFLFLIAVFFSIALNPIVTKIGDLLGIKNRTLSVSIAFGFIVIVITGFIILTIPPIVNQLSEVFINFDATVANFMKQDNFIVDLINRYELNDQINEGASNFTQYFKDNIQGVFDVVRTSITMVGAFIIMLVLTFMMLIEGPDFIKQIKTVFPKERSKKWQKLSQQMNKVIVGYISGQFIVALIAGLFSLLIMLILGVENAVALAGLVTFCSLIPLIGAWLGAILVVVLTLLTDVNLALILAVYFVIYQQVENMTIQPWIQSQQTNLTTLQVFMVALISGSLAGQGSLLLVIPGIWLALPIAACLKIVLIDYFQNNKIEIEKTLNKARLSKKR